MEDEIRKEYYDPLNGFSAQKIYSKLKTQFKHITLQQVKSTINNQQSKQIFQKKATSSSFPLVIPKVPFGRTQIDLLDLSNQVSNVNHGYKWLFVLVDSYTKLAFVRPMKNKSTLSCLSAFMEINEQIWKEYQEFYILVSRL